MGMFDRLKTITKAKANKALDALEGDGIEVMEQELVEAKKEYAKVKSSAAEVLVEVKRYERKRDEALDKAKQYHLAAANAYRIGKEDDALRCLEQEESLKNEAETYDSHAKNLKQKSEVLTEKMNEMRDSIEEAEAIYREAKVNVKVADAAEKVGDAKFDESALDRFNQRAEKTRQRYETVMAMDELESGDTDAEDLLGKYSAKDTDAKLKALKEELGME